MINGWEERSGEVTELVLYAPVFESYPSDIPIHTPDEPPAMLHRWKLNLSTGQVSDTQHLLTHGYESNAS